jgi:hypothetical protein
MNIVGKRYRMASSAMRERDAVKCGLDNTRSMSGEDFTRVRNASVEIVWQLDQLQRTDRDPQSLSSSFRGMELVGRDRVPEHRHALPLRDRLCQQLGLLFGQFRLAKKNAGHISARPRQALYEAVGDRIEIGRNHDDRKRPTGADRRLHCGFGTGCHDDVYMQTNQPERIRGECGSVLLDRAKFHNEVLPLGKTTLLHFVAEGLVDCPPEGNLSVEPNKADAR